VWNVSSKKSKAQWKVGELGTRAIAVHPKGKWAVTGDEGGSLKAWGLDKGDVLAIFPPDSGLATTALIFIDGGKQLLASRGGTSLTLYDVSSLRRARAAGPRESDERHSSIELQPRRTRPARDFGSRLAKDSEEEFVPAASSRSAQR